MEIVCISFGMVLILMYMVVNTHYYRLKWMHSILCK